MEIAIVDDQAAEREELRRLLCDYFTTTISETPITPIYSEFSSGEAFLCSFQKGKYQIVLLDIYMDQLTGIDVANRILSLDKTCNIIFFTTSTEHILEGYDVHAIGYILKPVSKHISSLHKALSYALDKLNPDRSSLTIVTEFGERTVPYRSILYLECSLRNLYLHYASDVIQISGKYIDYADILLADKRFLEPYRNLIVNMDYIDTIINNDFILTNKDKIPISRRKKADTMQRYTTYFIERRCF